MYEFLLGYVFLAVIVFRLGVAPSIRQTGSSGLMLVSGALGLFFCIFPILLILLGEQATRQLYVYRRYGVGDHLTLVVLLLTFVAFWLGYVIRAKFAAGEEVAWSRLNSSDEYTCLRYIAYGFVCLGLIGLTYQAVQAGGIFRMLSLSSCVRGSFCGMTGDFVFIRQLNYFVATGFMAYYIAHYQCDMDRVRNKYLPLVLIGILFAYQAASTAGRRDILYPMMICCSALYFSGYRKKEGFLVLFGIALVWWWLSRMSSSAYLDAVSSSSLSSSVLDFVGRYSKNVALDAIRGVGDSFMHFVAMQRAEVGQFGFMRDWVELPFEFLPTRLLDIDRGRGVMGEITSYMLGQELSPGLSGEEPPGLHGYALVNFGFIGTVFFFFAFGGLVRWIDERFHPRIQGAPVKWLIYLLIMWLLLEYMREGVISLVLKPRISWIALVVVFMWINQSVVFQKRKVK